MLIYIINKFTIKKNIELNNNCLTSKASRIIGDFWNILIVKELLTGYKRFNELQTSIVGITNSTLSDRLKFLIEEEIVERKQYECIPPKVEYTLTSKGKDLEAIINEVYKFGVKWLENK